MAIGKPKTLGDFPKFMVTAVRRGPTSDTGYTHFEIEGSFDRAIENIDPHWFWLLFGERGSLCASVKSLDNETRRAILSCEARSEPEIEGQALAYLSPYWQAYHVWMVVDPTWVWKRQEFHGLDAVAEDFEAPDVSIIGGREVKVWTKLSPVREAGGQSRYYAASDQSSSSSPASRIIPSGWDHEHCELCKAHIDMGETGYIDSDQNWMCSQCYERYVVRGDLAFVDGL